MNKQATNAAVWGDQPGGSYVNTAIPVSQIFGLTDRIPEGWVKMFPNTEGGQRAAHITFKAGFDALLAAGLIALYRGLNHVNRMSELAKSDNPAKGMKSQLSTTFAGSLNPEQTKTASGGALETPESFSLANTAASAIPLGAVILATSLAYRATDDYFDSKRNKALDDAIANKENVLKRLIKTRSRLAKGNASDSEVYKALGGMKNEDVYVKQANWFDDIGDYFRGTVGGLGTLSCLILGAAAVGSYAYFSKADENNIRYRAMKKGLGEYARVKSGFTPVAIIPTKGRKFFAEIDQEAPAKKKKTEEAAPVVESVRDEQPVLTDTYNKPISLTL